MRKIKRENIFIIIVFGLVYLVLTNPASITGNIVGQADNFYDESRYAFYRGYDGRMIHEFSLLDNFFLEIKDLKPQDFIHVLKGYDNYQITLLMVNQDFRVGSESIQLLISPGNRQFMVEETKSLSIDFDNDGQQDLLVTASSISAGKADLIVESSQKQPI